MTSKLDPGWYSGEDGEKRYWTGKEWIRPVVDDPSDPDDLGGLATEPFEGSKDPPPRNNNEEKSKSGRLGRIPKRLALFTLIAVLTGGLVVGGYGYYQHRGEQARIAAEEVAALERAQAEAERGAAEKKKREEEEQERKDREAKQEEDRRRRASQQQRERDAVDEHYTSGAAGAVFDVIEPGSLYFRYLEPAEYTCGYWRCIGVAVVSMKGCPGGVYVEVSLLDVNDNVIGYTNARMGALKAEEQGVEMLETPNDATDMFRVEKVNCRL